jgi:hypothetical protein
MALPAPALPLVHVVMTSGQEQKRTKGNAGLCGPSQSWIGESDQGVTSADSPTKIAAREQRE